MVAVCHDMFRQQNKKIARQQIVDVLMRQFQLQPGDIVAAVSTMRCESIGTTNDSLVASDWCLQ